MSKVSLDFEGKDNTQRAFSTVQSRLATLRSQIDTIKAKGEINLDVKDAGKLRALESEARRLERALDSVNGKAVSSGPAFTGLGGGASSAGVALRGLTSALGAVGIAVSAMGLVKAAFELGSLGESADRSRLYFQAWSGSAETAAINLAAVQRATGGALTSMEAMRAASKYLGMGLAKNAIELEQLAHMAVILGGDTRTATQAIEEFALMLANQSILRMDTFNLSSGAARTRMDELQKATAGMTREAAFLAVVMEQGAAKVKQLEEAGVKTATQTDIMQASVRELKLELGKLVAQPYTVVVKLATEAVQNLNFALSPEGAIEREYERAFQVYRDAAEEVRRAQAGLNSEYTVGNPLAQRHYEIKLREAQALMDVAEADYRAAQAAAALIDSGSGVNSMLANTASAAAAATGALAGMMSMLPGAVSGALGFDFSGWQRGPNTQEIVEHRIAEYRRKEQEATNKSIADDYARRMQAAVDKVSGSVQSKLGAAAGFSIGLNDMRSGGAGKPGENGPFEDIFRLQAWLSDGSWKETVDKLGIETRAEAEKIVQDFQNQIFSPEVQRAINVDQLIEQIQVEQASEESRKAFAAKIAAAVGLGGVGGAGGNIGGGGTTTALTDAFAKGAEVAVDNQAFKDRMAAVGGQAWVWTEGGFVKAASQSSALISAIDGMVASSLARRGVTAAANAAGAP